MRSIANGAIGPVHRPDQSPDTVFQENSEWAVLEFGAGAELGPPVGRLFESDANAPSITLCVYWISS